MPATPSCRANSCFPVAAPTRPTAASRSPPACTREEEAKLLAGPGRTSAARARAIALSAIRETYEEAGLLIGRKGAFATDKARLAGLCRTWRAAFPGHAALHRPRHHPAQPGAPLRHPLLQRLAQATSPWNCRMAAQPTSSRNWSGCRWPRPRQADIPDITRNDPGRTGKASRRRSAAAAGRSRTVLSACPQPLHPRTSVESIGHARAAMTVDTQPQGDERVHWLPMMAAISSISVVGIAIGLGMPLLSVILETRGHSASMIGLNTAVAGLASIAGAPLATPLAMRFGVAWTMVVMIAIGALAFRRLPFRTRFLDVVPAAHRAAYRADGAVHPVRVLDQHLGAAAPARPRARHLRHRPVARLRRRAVAVRASSAAPASGRSA